MAAEHHGVSTSTMPQAVQQQQRRGSSSHTTRPKIKIIHIIAPEIIKTDVANFRDLVQRLTGKQPTTSTTAGSATGSTNTSPPPLVVEEENKETTVKKRPLPPPAAPVTTGTAERSDDSLVQVQQQEPSSKKRKTIKCEVKVEEEGGLLGDYGLGCNDLWMGLNPGGSFLSFLEEELDVFQGLAAAADHDFLQPPLAPARMDLVGEMYAS